MNDFALFDTPAEREKLSPSHPKAVASATWLATPGLNGRAHVDSMMRKFIDLKEEYLNKWDLLDLS